jgi:hypothetical protein
MSVATAPHIRDVRPNSPEFRAALDTAGGTLRGSDLGVFSHHRHYPFDGVLLVEQVLPGELAMYPVSEAQAIRVGLPFCWGITPEGTVDVLRYTTRGLHGASGLDVTSSRFQAELARAAKALAAAGLEEVLELNIASCLFPHAADTVWVERTDEASKRQRLTLEPMPDAVKNGNWATAAAWRFTPQGMPIVAGTCTTDDLTTNHSDG